MLKMDDIQFNKKAEKRNRLLVGFFHFYFEYKGMTFKIIDLEEHPRKKYYIVAVNELEQKTNFKFDTIFSICSELQSIANFQFKDNNLNLKQTFESDYSQQILMNVFDIEWEEANEMLQEKSIEINSSINDPLILELLLIDYSLIKKRARQKESIEDLTSFVDNAVVFYTNKITIIKDGICFDDRYIGEYKVKRYYEF